MTQRKQHPALEEIREAERPSEMRPEVVAALAQYMRTLANNGTAATIHETHRELTAALRKFLQRMEPRIARAIQNATRDDAGAYDSYTMGQLAFAQLYCAQMASRLPSERFYSAFEGSNARILTILYDCDLSNKELSTRMNMSAENVSRLLRGLRESGVVDFKKIGRECINYLTPAAREYWLKLCSEGKLKRSGVSPSREGYVSKAVMQVSEQFHNPPQFTTGNRRVARDTSDRFPNATF